MKAKTKPEQPSPPIVEYTTRSDIFITFLTPTELKLNTTKYHLEFWRELENTSMASNFVNSTREFLIIKGLEQNAIYKLKVLLKTAYGDSMFSKEVTAQTTRTDESYHHTLREQFGLPQLESYINNGKIVHLF